jgi:hypothetical protein
VNKITKMKNTKNIAYLFIVCLCPFPKIKTIEQFIARFPFPLINK